MLDSLSAVCQNLAQPALQQTMKKPEVIPAYLPGAKFTARLIEDSKQKAQQIKAMGLDNAPR